MTQENKIKSEKKTQIPIENCKQYQKIFQKNLEDILYQVKHYYPQFSKIQEKRIEKAFWFGEKSHKGQTRFSGEPYFTHPIAATNILLNIKPDIETICACLLHDVIEDTPVTAEEIEKNFGKKVRFLCEGVEKITKVRLQGKERSFESLRKLFLAMAKDIRVIFIKLADRIHNLSTLDAVPNDKKIRIATESLKIYVPVADRLGIHQFKMMMEDLCFKHMHQNDYETLITQINQSKKDRQESIQNAKKELIKVLTKENVDFEDIQGRDKNLFSVYDKLKRKNYSHVSEIHDLLAIRVILKNSADCYRVLGILHSYWKPIPGRFKDYIAVPKPNGYKSLHTTILGIAKSKFPTEIQIRTLSMHMDAELGPAAHWAYKSNKAIHLDDDYLEQTNWCPLGLSELSKIQSPEKFFESITENLSSGRINILTPQGEVRNLPDKATPIDFAYAIHSDIGNTCIGAKVNGTIKPLDYELKAGDMVEIMTRSDRKPNSAWLNFVKSSAARHKINSFINQEKKELEERFPEPKREEEIKKIIPQKKKIPNSAKEKGVLYELIIGGQAGISFRFAQCCKPSELDEIIAYNTRGRHVGIHKASCKTLKKLDPNRYLEAEFVLQKKIIIFAENNKGLIPSFYDTFTPRDVFVARSKFKKQKPNILLSIFTLNVPSLEVFQEVLCDLRKIENVSHIQMVPINRK